MAFMLEHVQNMLPGDLQWAVELHNVTILRNTCYPPRYGLTLCYTLAQRNMLLACRYQLIYCSQRKVRSCVR